MKISAAVDGFMLHLSCGDYSATTLPAYKHYLSLLASYVGPDTKMTDLTEAQVNRFWAWFCTEYKPKHFGRKIDHPSQSTKHNTRAYLHTFFKWAEAELKIQRPDRGIQRPKLLAESPVQPFTEDEVHRMIAAAESVKIEAKDGRKFRIRPRLAKRNIAIIVVLLDSGLRVSELFRLDIRDYNAVTGELTVRARGTAQKTHGRLVYLGKRARQILWRYMSERGELRPEDPLFPSVDDRRMDGHSVYLVLKRIAKQAGASNCHPHRFRHTAAIQFLRNGGNVFVLQRMLGHRTLTMVRRYLQLGDQDTMTAMQANSPADRWRV